MIKKYRTHIMALAAVLFVLLPQALGQRNPQVLIETNLGNITVELYPDEAPVTVDNFLTYANGGFYDGLLFHRVIKDFMIQGGWLFYQDGQFKYYYTNPPIINESDNGLSNLKGTLAMARTAAPDSATAQFFINHADNLFLDRANAADGFGYCVFATVVSGMDVVDIIANVPVIPTGFSEAFPDAPKVEMEDVSVLPCDSVQCSDFNGDGTVNFADLALLSSYWLDDAGCGSANDFCSGTDLNYSGQLNAVDLNMFANNWLETVTAD